MTSTDIDEGGDKNNHPSPDELEEFLPWACVQFQAEVNIAITRSEQGKTKSIRGVPCFERSF